MENFDAHHNPLPDTLLTATSYVHEASVPFSPVMALRLLIKPGCKAAFIDATCDLINAAISHNGYQSREVIGLSDTGRDWLLILRFDNLAGLDSWQSSVRYRTCLERIKPLTDNYQVVQANTSEEDFVLLAGSTGLPKWKTALITVLGLYPLILWVFPYLSIVSDELGLETWLGKLITVILAVPLMTWFIVPVLMRLLRCWL